MLYGVGMLKHRLGKQEILDLLRQQRLEVNQERLKLSRHIAAAQARIDQLDERLRDIDHAEGML